MRDLVSAGWIGRTRAVLLVVLGLLAAFDLVTFVALVVHDESPGPDEVARAVVQAVADDDCSDIGDLVDYADLPPVLTSCIQGVPSPVEISDVDVVDTTVDSETAEVTVGVKVAGEPGKVVVELRRTGGNWLVTTVRPADS